MQLILIAENENTRPVIEFLKSLKVPVPDQLIHIVSTPGDYRDLLNRGIHENIRLAIIDHELTGIYGGQRFTGEHIVTELNNRRHNPLNCIGYSGMPRFQTGYIEPQMNLGKSRFLVAARMQEFQETVYDFIANGNNKPEFEMPERVLNEVLGLAESENREEWGFK